MFKLTYTDQSGWERTIEAGEGNPVVTVGRNADCGIQTTNGSVSRVHAMIVWRDGRLYVQDPPNGHPTNGTKVNGVRLDAGGSLELTDGAELLCGNFRIGVSSSGSGQTASEPQPKADASAKDPWNAAGSSDPWGDDPWAASGANDSWGDDPWSSGGAPKKSKPEQPAVATETRSEERHSRPSSPAARTPTNIGQQTVRAEQPQQRNGRGGYTPTHGSMSHSLADLANLAQGGDTSSLEPEAQASQRGWRPSQPQVQTAQAYQQGRPSQVQVQTAQAYQQVPQQQQYQQQQQMSARQAARSMMNAAIAAQAQGQAAGYAQQTYQQQAAVQQQTAGVNVQQYTQYPDDPAKLKEALAAKTHEADDFRASVEERDEQLKDLQTKYDERGQIMADYERRIEYHDSVVSGLKEMIEKLKDQLEHQKDQYHECKRDLTVSRADVDRLNSELASLKENLDSSGMATSNAETALVDLKMQINQKTRMLSDMQRELDLAQFSCKEERENVERLKENVEMLNAELENSHRKANDMKKVVEQHEVAFGELRGNLEDRMREIKMLQESLKNKSGFDTSALLDENEKLREEANRKSLEIATLHKRLKESGGEVSGLREQMLMAQEEVTSLQRKLDNVRREAQEAANAAAAEAAKAEFDALLARLRAIYQPINDDVSQWNEDMHTIDDNLTELQRVFVAYVKISPERLGSKDRARLEKALKDIDPKAVFEDIGSNLDSCQDTFRNLKAKLMELRNAIQM